MANQIRASIVGGAGYTSGELISILLNHPNVEIASISSTSNAGNLVSKVHTELLGETDLKFSEKIVPNSDVIFLCLGHGHSENFLKENSLDPNTKVIDLSNEFRVSPNTNFGDREFVYGLPELTRNKVKTAENIANPGCFATCIQLALLPLAQEKKVLEDVHINAITGSTGAGQSLSPTSHFSWRNNNVSFYKEFKHQHQAEIYQSIEALQGNYNSKVYFLPMRGDFTRGILAGVYLKSDLSEKQAFDIYSEYYKDHPFTHVSENPISMKQVVNTNKCALHIQKQEDTLLVTSVIDNLTKGASGQAVQNMNLMFGFEETLGLSLKPNKF